MKQRTPQSTNAWIDRISNQEMPALCSTIKKIEAIAEDDTSSLSALGQVVMHDHALTSRILKVANSAVYMGRNPVTTISRASVVLGITAIKNICITAKLLTSLLKNKKLTPQVYGRLLKLMAQSFHAGMIAKMMVKEHDPEIQEEAFIAALLNHFGESAFWSMGGPLTVELDELLRQTPASEKQAIISKKLGTSFEKISVGLAKSWNLGTILIHSLESPELRTPEIRSINTAVRLSSILADPDHSPADLEPLISDAAKLMNISEKEVHSKLERCTEQTIELLKLYGASVLTRFVNHTQPLTETDNNEADSSDTDTPELSGQALQLNLLRELAFLPNENADFNTVIQTAMEGVYRGINMHRCIVLLKSRDKTMVVPRFLSTPDSERDKRLFTINVKAEKNIFAHTLTAQQPSWVDNLKAPDWQPYLTSQLRQIVSSKGFFIAPVTWAGHCVGVFYADRTGDQNALNNEDFMSFSLFVQQMNMCLSVILSNKK